MGVQKAELFTKLDRENKYAVIFIHGLHGDPDATWKKDKNSKSLPELLALDKELNNVDIFSFGYSSNAIIRYDFTEISKILHAEIEARLGDKKIIFVAHSMGGLIAQQYLINHCENNNIQAKQQVIGIFYMAVPFKGSSLANVFSKLIPSHMQLKSLMKKNPALEQLQKHWVKYVFRGGTDNLPEELRVTVSEVALYGARDRVVSQGSASPFHVGARIVTSDSGHTDICKVDQYSAEYKHLRNFIMNMSTPKNLATSMVIHAHGWDKQGYKEEPDYELDWTKHFQINASPRIFPTPEGWVKDILPGIEFVSKEWSEKWAKQGKFVRIYGKLCLTGGLFLGTRLSYTKGVKLEVEHYGEIWTADLSDPNYNIKSKNSLGTNIDSKRAIVILSANKDIQNEVESYLATNEMIYKKVVNLLPPNGVGPKSIENSKQALSFALSVKNEIEQLKNEGINEIYLFLNTPLSLALFTGHHLTAMCPIKTFEFNGISYTPSCAI